MHTSIARFPAWASLGAALLLAGCLGQNPVKGPEVPVDSKALAQLTLDSADALVNQEKFTEAMVYYERAIALDSNLSRAYFGYAKAVSFHYRMDVQGLLADLEAAGTGNIGAFLDHPDSVLTHRLQAASRINRMLDALIHRDTLSTNANPLTDGKVKRDAIGVDHALYKLVYVLTSINDLDRNDTLDSRDRVYYNLAPGLLGNLDSLAEQVKTDTLLQSAINHQILELQSGLTDLQGLLSQIGAVPDTGSAHNEAKNQMDSTVASLGVTLPFYQFGDRKDNDGDGCIDEELIDSLDNDLDGFVDEDARLMVADGVNNDHAGAVDDAAENLAGSVLSPSASYLVAFVALSGQGQDWVKIKKGAANMNVRLRIQKDSLALSSRAVLPGYAAKLDSAKALVGGCWRNY